MATKSVALARKARGQEVPTCPSVRALWRSIGVESADPYLVAATTVVIAARERDGDWSLFLFVGPMGELQLIDFGSDGQAAVDVPSGFQLACAIPRTSYGQPLMDSNERAANLGAITRCIADRLRSHLTERALAS